MGMEPCLGRGRRCQCQIRAVRPRVSVWLAAAPTQEGTEMKGALEGGCLQSAPYQFSTGHAWRFITAMAYLWEQNGHPTPMALPAQLAPMDSFLLILAPFSLCSCWGLKMRWP